ncbi:MAG: hypothetical protein HY719_06820 [Planctomycetes bacterium]|nr:hypothetical protein [Planctomycetota bacterium]
MGRAARGSRNGRSVKRVTEGDIVVSAKDYVDRRTNDIAARLLEVVTSLAKAVAQIQQDMAIVKERTAPRAPLGFRAEPTPDN